MIHIKLHFPRCSGHVRKNRLIKSIVYRVGGCFRIPDENIRVILYESEFRSDIESNLGDFIFIEVLACPAITVEQKKELAMVLKDEVNVFAGTTVDKTAIHVRNADPDEYYGCSQT